MIRQLLQIKSGEGKSVLLLFLLSFFLVSASISGKTARDTFFLNQFDISYLPLMFVLAAIGVGIFVPLYSRLLQRRGPYKTLLITGLVAIVPLIPIQVVMERWMIPVLYVWIEVVATILAFQIWTIAGDLFDSRQAKRLFSIFAAGGSISFIAIGLWLQPFILQFGSRFILLVTMAFIAGAIGLSLWINRLPHPAARKKRASESRKKDEPLFTPYLKHIAFMTITMGIAATIVDYQFKFMAGTTYQDADQLAVFFGKFYAVSGLASLMIQLFITGRLLSTFGVLAGLMILPVSLLGGFGLFIFNPVLLSAFIGKFAEQTFTFTIHQPTVQLLWLPVRKWRKQFGKPLIDGTLRTTVDGLTGFITFFLVKLISLAALSIFAILAVIGWMYSAVRIRRGYIHTLNEALSARRLNFEDLQLDSLNHAMVETIDKTLKKGTVFEQLFILELIQSFPPDAWKETLEELLVSGTRQVRREVLKYAADLFNDQVIMDLVREPFVDAIPLAGQRKIQESIPDLNSLLDYSDDRIRAAAAGAILQIGQGPEEKAQAILREFLDSDDPNRICLGIEFSYDHESLPVKSRIPEYLSHDDLRVRKAGIQFAERYPATEFLASIIENLGLPGAAKTAGKALRSYQRDDILDVIQSLVNTPPLTDNLKRGIIAALRTIPGERSQQILLSFFDALILPIYNLAVDALLDIGRKDRITRKTNRAVKSSIRFLARRVYSHYQVLYLIKDYPEATLLKDYLRNEIQMAIPILVKLGAIDDLSVPVNQCIKSLQSGDPEQFSYGLELLETIFSREERDLVTPLIDRLSMYERVQAGRKLFSNLPTRLDTVLEDFLYSKNDWLVVISLAFALTQHTTTLQKIDWTGIRLTPLMAEILSRLEKENAPWIGTLTESLSKFDIPETMYTTLEKTIFLKSVSLFKKIPAEIISRIAMIAEEVSVLQGDVIFKEGDDGDAMYVIVEGKISIQKGRKQIASLGKWDCMGEMALLEDEPRSADAAAEEDSILLRISQESFSELLNQNPGIMFSLLRLLSGRLRKAIQ